MSGPSGRKSPVSGRFSHQAASLLARGEPMVWLTGFGLVVGLLMVTALVGFVFYQGFVTFWPVPVVQLELNDDTTVMGEVTRSETFEPGQEVVTGLEGAVRSAAEAELVDGEGRLHRRLVRTGNFEINGEHFRWVEDFLLGNRGVEKPEWALLFERKAWGRFYGVPIGFLVEGNLVTEDAARSWDLFQENFQAEAETGIHVIRLQTASGETKDLDLADVVRAYPANQLGLGKKFGIYLGRWHEFLTAEPREANSEGGVFPAIFGTVVMTLGMTLLVVPFGVMSALYLREYAGQGWMTSIVRISINNLAGVPSIVFGVFGLGFFS